MSHGRTPLFRKVRRALALARSADRAEVSASAYLDRLTCRPQRTPTLTRRELLGAALGSTAAVASLAKPLQAQSRSSGEIAVVGAGVAGLVAAYRLQQRGVASALFDSWSRVGGRIFSSRQGWRDGQVAELGGELIDSGHTALLRLAAELDIPVDAILEAPNSGITQDTWHFGGQRLTDEEVVAAFSRIAPRLAEDAALEEDPVQFERLDVLGLEAYLDALPDLDPLLRRLLEMAYVAEYGRELAEQSPWNLLWLIDFDEPDPFRVYGDSDEALHLHGGNDQLTTALAGRLTAPIELEQRLVRVRERADGRIELVFALGQASFREHVCDRVVFALPFTRLREVEFRPGLPEEKAEIIQTLGMGTNSKLMSQYDSRVWRDRHEASGSVTTDNGLQLTWETSRGQPGESGLMTFFAGGREGLRMGRLSAEGQLATRLPLFDSIFPGARGAYLRGSAARMHWPTVPHTLGSYSCYLPGQARFSGLEGTRVGAFHFCGEHTSVDFQGYMNGAVESGERVAREIARRRR